jgi:hypothetical protein
MGSPSWEKFNQLSWQTEKIIQQPIYLLRKWQHAKNSFRIMARPP